jgi:hypothetical protein
LDSFRADGALLAEWVILLSVRLRSILATFLGSFLLFLLEPMVAKALLPRFGGSSLVWNGSLLFFQGLLLAGYAYAHIGVRRLGLQKGAKTHFMVLGLAVVGLVLFVGPWLWKEKAVSGFPIGDLLLTLFLTTALPFFVLSAGTPLIQRWFGASDDPQASDPYFLYAASNFGSLIGLLSYPALLEPAMGLQTQRLGFGIGLLLYVGVLATCVKPALAAKADEHEIAPELHVAPKLALKWAALAAAPSALLLAVTSDLTKNVAPIPLLWVLPLGLYLITFIIAFSGRKVTFWEKFTRYGLPIILFPSAVMVAVPSSSLILGLSVSLLTFFVLTLACHLELARQRPEPKFLTAFYLWLSVGGALGGLCVALIAPVLFSDLTELPLALFACAAFYAWSSRERDFRWKWMDLVWPVVAVVALVWVRQGTVGIWLHWSLEVATTHRYDWIYLVLLLFLFSSLRTVRFALTFGAFLLSNVIVDQGADTVLEVSRNYYGSHTVKSYSKDTWHMLVNGSTIHGAQCMLPDQRREPMTYYTKTGPVGQALLPTEKAYPQLQIGAVGLGSGTISAYGRAGDTIEFFELNPAIKRMAYDRKLFTYVTDSAANVSVTLGDARLSLESIPDGKYDVLILDAFSSDSIPVHLLTKEAYALYSKKLKPDGMLLVHTSNRFLKLSDVVISTAASEGFVADFASDAMQVATSYHAATTWVAMAKNKNRLKLIEGGLWQPKAPSEATPVWTDDYSNVFKVLRLNWN